MAEGADVAAMFAVLNTAQPYYSSKDDALAAWRHVPGVSMYQWWLRANDGGTVHRYCLLAPHQIGKFVASHPYLHSVAVADEPTRVAFDFDQPYNPTHPHPFAPNGVVTLFENAWNMFRQLALGALIDGDPEAFVLRIAWSEVDFRERRKTSIHFVTHAALKSPAEVCTLVRFFFETATEWPENEQLREFIPYFDRTIYRPTGFQLRMGMHFDRQTMLVHAPWYDSAAQEWRYVYERREMETPSGAVQVVYTPRVRSSFAHASPKSKRAASKIPMTCEFFAAQRLQGAWVFDPPFTGDNIVCARNSMPVHPLRENVYMDVREPRVAVESAFSGAFDSVPLGRAILSLLNATAAAFPKQVSTAFLVDRKRTGVVYSSICPCHGYDAWTYEMIGEPFAYKYVAVDARPLTLHERGSTQVMFKMDATGHAVFVRCESMEYKGAYRFYMQDGKLAMTFYPK